MWIGTVEMAYIIVPALCGLICIPPIIVLFKWYRGWWNEAMWLYTQPKWHFIADRQMKFATVYLRIAIGLTIISVGLFVLSGIALMNWLWG